MSNSHESQQGHASNKYKPADFVFECHKKNLSAVELDCLKKYGWFMLGLELGHIEPKTSAQKHFVEVVKHGAEAITEFEQIWLDYRTQCEIDKLPHAAAHDPGEEWFKRSESWINKP